MPTTEINAVLFDVGGVLIDDNEPEVFQAIADVYGIPIDEARQAVKAVDDGLSRGHDDEPTFWKKVTEYLGNGREIPPQTATLWRDAFEASFRPDNACLGIAERLRKAGYMTGIISDIEPSHLIVIRESGITRGFDPTIFSCEVGHVKPERDMYQLALERLEMKPGEVIYTDNRQPKLKGGMDIGMSCHLYRGAAGLDTFLNSMRLKY